MDAWDRKETKVVTGYSRILALRVKNVKYGWDKFYLNTNKVRWHQHYRNLRSSGMEYDMSNKDTWCKLCNSSAVEDGKTFFMWLSQCVLQKHTKKLVRRREKQDARNVCRYERSLG